MNVGDEDARRLFEWIIEHVQREGGTLQARGLGGAGTANEWAVLVVPDRTPRLLEILQTVESGLLVGFRPTVQWDGNYDSADADLEARDVLLKVINRLPTYEDAFDIFMRPDEDSE